MGHRGRLALALIAVVGLQILALPAVLGAGAETTTWDGNLRLAEDTTIPSATILEVAPGTTVRPASGAPAGGPVLHILGHLEAGGTDQAPVVFEVPVVVHGQTPGRTLVEHASFEPSIPARCALVLHTGEATVERSSFRGSDNGLCLEPSGAQPAREPVRGDDHSRSGSAADGRPARGLEATLGLPRTGDDEPSPSADRTSGLRLAANAYVGNPHAGLRIAAGVPGSSSVGPIVSEGALASDNGVGVLLEADALRVVLHDATIADNRVGILADGGSAHLDHATISGNQAWDVHATEGPHQVTWTGSDVEPACVHVEGHDGFGCQRGSVGGVTVLTIVLGILYSLVFLASEAGRFLVTRIWLWIRLYTRIPKDELLEQETRQQLLELVREDPGRHLRDLARETGGYGCIAHHLHRLVDEGFLRARRDGFLLRFYPVGVDPSDCEPKGVREHVLAAVDRAPGIYAAEIARRIDSSRQLVSYHLQNLRARGKVEAEPDDQVIRLYPSGDDDAVDGSI